MSFVWGCYFHASFQFLGNPDVRCRSRSKFRATGLTVVRDTTFVVRRGWSRQCGNFVHGGSATSNIPVNKIV